MACGKRSALTAARCCFRKLQPRTFWRAPLTLSKCTSVNFTAICVSVRGGLHAAQARWGEHVQGGLWTSAALHLPCCMLDCTVPSFCKRPHLVSFIHQCSFTPVRIFQLLPCWLPHLGM